MAICKYCGVAFQQLPGGQRKYHSDACQKAAEKSRHLARKNQAVAEQRAKDVLAAINKKAEDVDNSKPKEDLFDISQFGEVANIESPDLIKGLMWIYNNLAIANPDPTKAPSMGDYSHLKYLQQNPEAKKDFLKSVYPRLIPPKSQLDGADKFNDDNRAIFDILERLQKECAVSTS